MWLSLLLCYVNGFIHVEKLYIYNNKIGSHLLKRNDVLSHIVYDITLVNVMYIYYIPSQDKA